MSQNIKDLIQRVEEFSIDEGEPALTFAARLAREQRWNAEFARRVIVEYKRFMLLKVAASHAMTLPALENKSSQ